MVKFNYDKEEDFSEWFDEVLKEAELVDKRYPAKGFIVHRPNAEFVEDKIMNMFEETLKGKGHVKARFPSVIPNPILEKEAEHIEGFEPEVFWIEKGGKKELPERLGLRPTSETIMYTMYSKWIESYRDLPLKVYQRCVVWRHETKHTRPLLRDREFEWIEAHNVFATRKEAEEQVLEDIDTAKEVITEGLGVPFYYFKRPSWDKFAGSEYTFGSDALMPNGRLLQIPSTHLLGQNFSKPFKITYEDRDEEEKYGWQTCFGPAVGRIFAAYISIHGDNKGLRLTWKLAPTQVVIVPILHGKNQEILDKCKELEEKLRKMNIRVDLDDSEDTPGEKFNHWEMMGAPVRIEIGGNELKESKITIKRRDTGKREEIQEAELESYVNEVPEKILDELKSQAMKHFKGRVEDADSIEDIDEIINRKNIARANWCSLEDDGEECSDILTAETKGAKVRGERHGVKEEASGKCIVCGKKAKHIVYIGKEY